MNIYIFANEKELIGNPYLADSKESAQEMLKEVIDGRLKIVDSNIENINENIKSYKEAIEEFNADKEKGEVDSDEIGGINFIEFQEGLITEAEEKIKEQELSRKALTVNVEDLTCFVISEKA